MNPLVSVICVCYNHERFVLEALESVKAQTYSNIEIIIVDDGSADKSVALIHEWVNENGSPKPNRSLLRTQGDLLGFDAGQFEMHPENPTAAFINLKSNHGYCKAFNRGLYNAKGDFIIDFATDDVMETERITKQVGYFSSLNNSYGVIFSDATYIDPQGKYLRDHFAHLIKKGLITHIPQGEIYPELLSTYFIPSPTMMVRANVLQQLGGYDETLSYEDFDFWIRSSREFKYGFLNEKLMRIRRNIHSMSSGWYKKGDTQLMSTYQVCRKAQRLNRNEMDWKAWVVRVKYELRQSVFSENEKEAKLFFELLKETNQVDWFDKLLARIGQLHLPLSVLRNLYHRIRFQPFT